MSYITLLTGFYRDPKVLALGNTPLARIARDLYIGSLMYSREHLTDGFVPLQSLRDIDPLTSEKDVKRAALALYSVGLFQRKRGRFTGYLIPHYDEHQQTQEEVKSARLAARDRKRRQRERASVTPMSHRDEGAGHGVTGRGVTPTEQNRREREEDRPEDGPVGDHVLGEGDGLAGLAAAAALVEAIRPEFRDPGTRQVVFAYARELPAGDLDRVRLDLEANRATVRNDGKWVNGALQTIARKKHAGAV